MRGVVMYGPGDVCVEDRPEPTILKRLMELIWNGQIHLGKGFDLELPLDQAAAGYRAMDTRQAIKALLRP